MVNTVFIFGSLSIEQLALLHNDNHLGNNHSTNWVDHPSRLIAGSEFNSAPPFTTLKRFGSKKACTVIPGKIDSFKLDAGQIEIKVMIKNCGKNVGGVLVQKDEKWNKIDREQDMGYDEITDEQCREWERKDEGQKMEWEKEHEEREMRWEKEREEREMRWEKEREERKMRCERKDGEREMRWEMEDEEQKRREGKKDRTETIIKVLLSAYLLFFVVIIAVI
ncbi:hypothetical protein HOY80DRAFT_1021385 [Tuber brumale]|nr:hypothetical protein HOY80DRAFT_1021385 [Tuber brumale]